MLETPIAYLYPHTIPVITALKCIAGIELSTQTWENRVLSIEQLPLQTIRNAGIADFAFTMRRQQIESDTRDSQTVGRTGLTSMEIDTIKGIYILLIVIGHNVLLMRLFPEFRNQIYSFHVAGFLVFPFLFKPGQLSRQFLSDRAARYLVPQATFYTCCAVLFATFISRPDSVVAWSLDYIGGLLIGSHPAVKTGSGFALFWFLPAMFTLTMLRAIAASGKTANIAIILFCLALHLTAGAAPAWAKHYVPMGALIAAYIYPLGVALEAVWPRAVARGIHQAGIAGVIVLPVCIYLSIKLGTSINLGKIRFYTFDNIPGMLLHDLYILSAFVTIAWISVLLSATRLLSIFGKYSLVIYLTHSLIFQLLLVISRKAGLEIGNWPAASVILFLTLLLALATALAIYKLAPLRVWLTPRYAAQWPPLATHSR